MNVQQELSQRVTETYKSYEIEVTAIPLREPEGSFTPHLVIRKDERSHVDETLFHSGQVFPDAKSAQEAGLEMGRRKIDAGFQPTNIVTNHQPDFRDLSQK